MNMRSLNKYLNESLLDDEEDLVNDETAIIEKFLKDNYTISGSYKIHENIVDIIGNIYLKSYIKQLTNGMFKFGKIYGSFYCANTDDLLILDGAPNEVQGDFDCSLCYNLKNILNSPKIVDGNFNCSFTPIKDLTGAPEKVGEDFDCSDCSNLKSLKGLPKKIEGILYYHKTPVYNNESVKNELKRKKIKYYEIGLPF